MDKTVSHKISLGTAQFGLGYGIANRRGKISKKEAFEILDYAFRAGVDTIDTASAYGDSENLIGEFVGKNKCTFKIISKFSYSGSETEKGVEDILHSSLSRLKADRIYGYLVHKFEDFLKNNALWDTLIGLKKKGLIEKIGFSIYTTEELKKIVDKRIPFDILQIPYSVFDRRFEGSLSLLKERGVEICSRSAFLQGLVFMEPETLPRSLAGAGNSVRMLRNLSAENNMPVGAVCLNFALTNPHIDKVIIGVDGLRHLKDNLADIRFMEKVRSIHDRLNGLMIKDEDILLPYRWSKI